MGARTNVPSPRPARDRAGPFASWRPRLRELEAAPDASSRTPLRARTVAVSLVVGIAVGVTGALLLAPPRGARFEARQPWTFAAPSERDWPRPPREGEAVRLETRDGSPELVLNAGSARDARELVRAFAARHEPAAEDLAAAWLRTRKAWREAPKLEPEGTQTRNALCAAVLLARTRWGRDLARDLPLADPKGPTPDESAPPQVEDSWLNVTWVVDDRDATVLMAAVVEATRLETRWFADSTVWSGWQPTARADAWRRWQRSREKLIEPITEQLLAWEQPRQQRNAEHVAATEFVVLADRVGDPWTAFAARHAEPLRPRVRPIASVWVPPLLVGAGAGSLGALFAMLIAAFLHPVLPRPRALAASGAPVAEDELASATPSLHIVTGSRPDAILRVALELAAHRLAAGDRVLLVDGSPRLRLHERIGRDARWGLLECLAADMPVLGLVQYAGHPGLYLLPHGQAERAIGWSPLGRKLDEVLPHFRRIVLLLEPRTPGSVGDALRGRPMEGWWAGSETFRSGTLEQAMSRLGIAIRRMQMADLLDASLEALAARVTLLRPAGAVLEPLPIPEPGAVAPVASPKPVLEPIVLDCDLQVLQRLRFLAWMRRVQAEGQRVHVEV
jgi:hypothetical protein